MYILNARKEFFEKKKFFYRKIEKNVFPDFFANGFKDLRRKGKELCRFFINEHITLHLCIFYMSRFSDLQIKKQLSISL